MVKEITTCLQNISPKYFAIHQTCACIENSEALFLGFYFQSKQMMKYDDELRPRPDVYQSCI
jgi:hypothetical protein